MTQTQKTTYKDAGVDIERGDAFVERIKSKVRSTYGERVVSGVGGFAALYKITDDKLLATGTDGCGTKVKVAQSLNKHDTIGIDLVAMCVNDIICTGATPLFFLDYLATGKLDLNAAEEIINGVVEGCKQSQCALIGGETAEMPGVYGAGEYDLAGFAVGEVLEKDLKDGRDVAVDDTLIALPSSGVHSNGYSLVRKLVNETERELLLQALTPTRIYWNVVREVLPLVKAMAHITGGGLENVPRMNDKFDYVLDYLPALADIPPIYAELVKRSGLEGADLYRTFNMGIGFVFATAQPEKLAAKLKELNQPFWTIGKVAAGTGMTVVKTADLDFSC